MTRADDRFLIAVYTDEETSSGQLTTQLRKSFDLTRFNVAEIKANDLKNGFFSDPALRMVALPGVYRNISKYRTSFNKAVMQDYMGFIHDRGGVSLNICAGAYHVSRVVDYETTDGYQTVYLKQDQYLFSGTSRGPIPAYAPRHDCAPTISPVIFQARENRLEQTALMYRNGQIFIPDNPDDPAIQPLIAYQNLPRLPLAAMRVQYGAGVAYLCALHLESEPIENPKTYIELNTLLDHYKDGQKSVWAMLMHKLKQDLKP
jgi:glutamine amidotransferase-like uncharacterized protein